MEIIQAALCHCAQIYELTQCTIRDIYPRYYPPGAVEFFCTHHSPERIEADTGAGAVWMASGGGTVVGTVTVKGNEMARLFVLPVYQGRGYGRRLMDFAERLILDQYETVTLDASLPALEIYLARGYEAVAFRKIRCDNGHYLCYNEMNLHKRVD